MFASVQLLTYDRTGGNAYGGLQIPNNRLVQRAKRGGGGERKCRTQNPKRYRLALSKESYFSILRFFSQLWFLIFIKAWSKSSCRCPLVVSPRRLSESAAATPGSQSGGLGVVICTKGSPLLVTHWIPQHCLATTVEHRNPGARSLVGKRRETGMGYRGTEPHPYHWSRFASIPTFLLLLRFGGYAGFKASWMRLGLNIWGVYISICVCVNICVYTVYIESRMGIGAVLRSYQ